MIVLPNNTLARD